MNFGPNWRLDLVIKLQYYFDFNPGLDNEKKKAVFIHFGLTKYGFWWLKKENGPYVHLHILCTKSSEEFSQEGVGEISMYVHMYVANVN